MRYSGLESIYYGVTLTTQEGVLKWVVNTSLLWRRRLVLFNPGLGHSSHLGGDVPLFSC